MADETGGALYQSHNDLGSAMGKVLGRTELTYLLAFQPEKLKADGKFRPLEVRLRKDVAKGADLVYRSGYYPPKPFEAQSALERQLATAAAVLGDQSGGSFDIATLAAPFPMLLPKSYVPVFIEVDGPDLVGKLRDGVLYTEIFAYALDESGAVKDFFTRRLGLKVEAAREALLAGGLKYYGHLELEPGEYLLRVLVRNGATGEQSLDLLPLSVPDWSDDRAVLLSPFFPETENRWVLTQEEDEGERAGVVYPFLMREEPFVPAARPRVGREGIRVVLMGRSLGDSLEGQLLLPDGTPVSGGSLRIVERAAMGIQDLECLVAELELGDEPPGEYLLTVSAVGSGSEPGAAASTGIVIGDG
jgi:hypothetical protein